MPRNERGLMFCDSCELLRINGVVCHETGCPDAWKDHEIACRVCGFDFLREERWQAVCPDCQRDLDECEGGDFDDEDPLVLDNANERFGGTLDETGE